MWAYTTWDAFLATKRIRDRESEFTIIELTGKHYNDSEFDELADCLIENPNSITRLYVDSNKLSDKSGVKIARFLARSTTVEALNLSDNKFGDTTYLAIADALRFNSSLRWLFLEHNQPVDQTHIVETFVGAVQVNSARPVHAWWRLFSGCGTHNDFPHLATTAAQLGHPSLQSLLNHELEKNTIRTTRRVTTR